MFPFKLSLNASTLFPFGLGIKEQLRIAAEAGYEGFEIWIRDLEAYVTNGGSIRELKRYIADTGIAVVNAIAFFKWSDQSPEVREEGLRQAEREMRMLAELGCPAVAAPPFGEVGQVTLDEMAVNYARLAELGDQTGVVPYLEIWGRAKKLARLSEAIYVAAESGRTDIRILLDPFHMHTGGSRLEGLSCLNGNRIGIVHVNDYPASSDPLLVTDEERLFPGDGAAPSSRLSELLRQIGYTGYLSLELFAQDYGDMSAVEVASHGIKKIKKAYGV